MPSREIPPIPRPKSRKKGRYSLVIIGDSGVSRQVELTPFRIRVGLAGVAGVLCLIIVLAALSWGRLSDESSPAAGRNDLVAKITDLEEKLREKELALSVQAKRMKEMQPASARAETAPSDSSQPGESGAMDGASASGTPASAVPEEDKGKGPLAAASSEDKDRSMENLTSALHEDRAISAGGDPPDSLHAAGHTGSKPPLISFDAQEVMAVMEKQNRGVLSFRLIKDSPELLFTGYLFVFVEMEDKEKESLIQVYPKGAVLGEGDLPKDFHEGESISFKYDSRVRLTYKDPRPSAKLQRISILLYGQDGNIVFQRGFDGRDLNKVTKAATTGKQIPRRPVGRRQAL